MVRVVELYAHADCVRMQLESVYTFPREMALRELSQIESLSPCGRGCRRRERGLPEPVKYLIK